MYKAAGRSCARRFGPSSSILPSCDRLLVVCLLAIALSGCLSSRRLRKDEYLLFNQTVHGTHTISSNDLVALLPQKPNSRLLRLPLTPKLWFYQLGSRNFNAEAVQRELAAKTTEFELKSQQLASDPGQLKKLNRRFSHQAKRLRRKIEEGNWVMRALGEPPVYFNPAEARTNAAKLRTYLFEKGFFRAKTSFTLDTIMERRIRVNYQISEGVPFNLKTITYEIADPRVDSIVRASLRESPLKAGNRYDTDKFNVEKVRIEELLRNQGYYTFSRQYVRPLRDTTINTPVDTAVRYVDFYIQIPNPPGQSAHPIYTIGDVTLTVGADPAAGTPLDVADTVTTNRVHFRLGGYDYSTRLLSSKIRLRPGQLYSQANQRETQRQLFLLNQFKFANLNFVDTTNRQLRTEITTTPLDKYDYSFEGGVSVLYQGAGLPGPFANLSLRARNVFGGLETLETSLRYGFEYQTGFNVNGSNKAYQAQEFGLNTALTFPQILFPGRYRFQFSNENPRTQISLGYNSTIRPDYTRRNLRSTMSYNWQKSPARQFSLFIADVNLLNSLVNSDTIGRAFSAFLNEEASRGSTIKQSFRNAFFSSISLTYTYNASVVNQNRRANFLRTSLESGGTTLNFFNTSAIQRFFNTSDTTGLQFYKYLRASVDFRHYVPLQRHTTLAFRINSGFVIGYGPNKTAPYEKLFFAGGSNSVRAWLPRRLGPGSAYPRTDPNHPTKPAFNQGTGKTQQFDYSFEQPGNVLLEGSAELRGRLFHLGGDFNGAVFIDAGNVWQLNNNQRPGANFQFNTFLSQIAVGTGVGLRIDFSFFVIRLDGGIKVYDPARRYVNANDQLVDERFILPKFSLRSLSNGPNPLQLQFGIGYPF